MDVQKMRGLAFVLAAVVLWSTQEVVVRTIVNQVTPLQLAAVRFSIGGCCIALLLPWTLRRRGLRLTRQVLGLAAVLALVGVLAASILYQYALANAGAGVVAAVYGTNPLMVLGLSAMLLNERLTMSRLAGILTGFVGIVVLSLSEPSDTFSLFGLACAVGTVFAFAVFTVLVKRFAGAYAGLPIVTLCALFGSAYLWPLVLLEGETAMLDHAADIWPAVLYLGVCTTGMTYLFYFLGVQRVDTTQTSSCLLLKPPLATALAAVTLGEPVTWNLGAAVVLVIAGLYLVIHEHRASFRTAPSRTDQPSCGRAP
jgi:drug/metabolite transporter (DMT)-like permease